MRAILKGDHYQTNLIFDCNNCKIMETNSEWTFIKVEKCILDRLHEIKQEINKIVIRNPEFYCDCKKYVKYKDTFEEVVKVKTPESGCFDGGPFKIKLEMERIWIGKSSYGPLLKIINVEQETLPNVNFVETEETQEIDSDEEINNHFEMYNKIDLKKTTIKKKRGHGKRNTT